MYTIQTIFNDGLCKSEKTNDLQQATGAFQIYMLDTEVEYSCIVKNVNHEYNVIATYDIRRAGI